jgi:hypothetical protein
MSVFVMCTTRTDWEHQTTTLAVDMNGDECL